MKAKKKGKAYAAAGVDIAMADKALSSVKTQIKAATRPEVMGAIGGFGGLFDLSKCEMEKPVLVSSTDGVGTKLKVAFMANKHDGVGFDIVNHCLNDIAVMGAEPLFFLDYLGTGKLEPRVFKAVVSGMAKACKAANTALIGGETAEMPGFYQTGEYDVVGTVVGIVEKKLIMSGKSIRPGDKVIGLASNGLHTNGYSLARNIIFEKHKLKHDSILPGTRARVSTALLRPHTNYSATLTTLLREFNKGKKASKRKKNAIFGLAHITGGGFSGNIPRVLPEDCDVVINTNAWPKLPIFKFFAQHGNIDFEELYEVFNMGIGMTMVVSEEYVDPILNRLVDLGQKAWAIGDVIEGKGGVQLV